MLVDGRWTENWQPVQGTDAKGGFVRQTSSFRHFVTPDGSAGPTGDGGFSAEAGRYHLYVALICPWASRTLIARRLKGLEDVVSVSVVRPELGAEGWRFGEGEGSTDDPVNGARFVHELYTRADPHVNGRATVPVLWDKRRGTIVNNESADIVRMFNSGFGALAQGTIDLRPADLEPEIDALNDWLYPRLNNGVYRAGFATTQGPTRRLTPASSRRWTRSRIVSAEANRSCSANGSPRPTSASSSRSSASTPPITASSSATAGRCRATRPSPPTRGGCWMCPACAGPCRSTTSSAATIRSGR